jgi:uncharacterized protein HemX
MSMFLASLRSSSVQLVIALALVVGGFGVEYAVAQQPHMQRALEFLQNANRELRAASEGKGGHREEAIKLVESAIAQVREGIAAGR